MTTPSRCLAQLALATLLAAAGTVAAAPATEKSAAPAAGPQLMPPMHAPAMKPAEKKKPAKSVKLVDINKAGRAELKTLPMIGDAEADKIIANRPYLSKADLVTKDVLPEGIYISIKRRVVASQKPGKLPAKK